MCPDLCLESLLREETCLAQCRGLGRNWSIREVWPILVHIAAGCSRQDKGAQTPPLPPPNLTPPYPPRAAADSPRAAGESAQRGSRSPAALGLIHLTAVLFMRGNGGAQIQATQSGIGTLVRSEMREGRGCRSV